MSMLVPVIECKIQNLGEFIHGFKTPSLQGQRAQLLPPRFNQVEPASVLGNELHLHFRPGCQRQASVLIEQQSFLDFWYSLVTENNLFAEYASHVRLGRSELWYSIP
jgi:hypothetical protein